ncbi:thiol reductase thioredoxin [Aestuariivita boseongensis]|uniref:thiol reductase thioredoxin n=1 Tax=Aestuariivita boseongensis TaxID=1470562 RepID=UPI0012F92652|nr:thiol reductase thioredoxin [Aestuariivita boseongensis]
MKPHQLICLICGHLNRFAAQGSSGWPDCWACNASLVSDAVAGIDEAIHNAAILHDSLPLIVGYWTPGSRSSRHTAAEFARTAKDLRDAARFAHLDPDSFPGITGIVQPAALPLIVLYARGIEVARSSCIPISTPNLGVYPARDSRSICVNG